MLGIVPAGSLGQQVEIPAFTLECGKGKNPLPLEQGFSIYTRLRRALFLFPTMF